jgi:hypothetical protein
VIAFAEGAACELVIDGRTGFLVDDEAAMAAAVDRRGEIDPRTSRTRVTQHCAADAVAVAYERVYRSAVRPDVPRVLAYA